MAQGKQQLSFGRNLLRQDNCDTDYGRWTNFDFMRSADKVKHS